jgi:pyruvate/2-oxoglutarate dehydrogenase complex dihydrolipoamide dehydrogenase (E3) component
MDGELAGLMAEELSRRGVQLVLGTSTDEVKRGEGGLSITLSTRRVLTTDAVLFAAGRTPNATESGLSRPACNRMPTAGSSWTATTAPAHRGFTPPVT